MASPTKKTKRIRKRKKAGQGQKRKGKLRQEGTTLTQAELFGDNQ